jgi:hypothetical protein
MRKHTRDTRTRSDVTKTVDDRSAELKEKTDVAGQHADDVATERETLEGVDLSGTQEAADALKDSLESAQEVSAREFTEEGESLEQVQREGEEFEQELRERSDATDRGCSESLRRPGATSQPGGLRGTRKGTARGGARH